MLVDRGPTFYAVTASGRLEPLDASHTLALTRRIALHLDHASVAAALSAIIKHDGGADVVFCGAATSSLGSGAVPGYLSAMLEAGLRSDVVEVHVEGDALSVALIDGDTLMRSTAAAPLVIAAALYGINVRAVSPILLMRVSKKPIEEMSLAAPLPSTGAIDEPLESNRKRRLNEMVEGPDAAARAVTLVSALRERQLV
jgi:electron transfer flavoprotein alpha/beta subunit